MLAADRWLTDTPDAPPGLEYGIRDALVRAWWDDRLHEGHTAAGARMLLELMLPPHLAARVAYDDIGARLLST